MSKHAYLLLNHGNHLVVEACIRMIDDPRNDIFVLADQEERSYYSQLKTQYSKIVVLDTNVKITWCGTIWEGMFELIKTASKGHYGYYHLLSESDLPIKSQDAIHDFFDNDPDQMIYMHVNRLTFKEIQERVMTNYPFLNSPRFRISKPLKALALALVKLKIFFGVNRLKDNKEIPVLYNGWNWFSIPDDFAQYVVSKEQLLHHTFDHTLSSDEVFLQSLAMNSKFRYRMYGYDGKDNPTNASKRLIWSSQSTWRPHIMTKDDYQTIRDDKNCYFARKFYEDTDLEIVSKLEKTLKPSGNN